MHLQALNFNFGNRDVRVGVGGSSPVNFQGHPGASEVLVFSRHKKLSSANKGENSKQKTFWARLNYALAIGEKRTQK